MQLFGVALALGMIGLAAGLVGAVIAAYATRSRTSTLTSYVQHFAAGLIIAAATLDLVPEALYLGGGWPLIMGFVLGTAFMLTLRAVFTSYGHSHAHGDEHGHSPSHGHGHGDTQAAVGAGINLRLIIALAVVVLIDAPSLASLSPPAGQPPS